MLMGPSPPSPPRIPPSSGPRYMLVSIGCCRKKPERIDPLARSPQGDTALHRAAIHGHEGVVREIPKTANYNKICDMLRYPSATKN